MSDDDHAVMDRLSSATTLDELFTLRRLATPQAMPLSAEDVVRGARIVAARVNLDHLWQDDATLAVNRAINDITDGRTPLGSDTFVHLLARAATELDLESDVSVDWTWKIASLAEQRFNP